MQRGGHDNAQKPWEIYKKGSRIPGKDAAAAFWMKSRQGMLRTGQYCGVSLLSIIGFRKIYLF